MGCSSLKLKRSILEPMSGAMDNSVNHGFFSAFSRILGAFLKSAFMIDSVSPSGANSGLMLRYLCTQKSV